MKVLIKPLSVNDAWQGRRFKTHKYKAYESELLFRLPRFSMPQPPYEAFYTFGLSSILTDVDNGVKPLQDILSKKYNFNDRLIHKVTIQKVKTEKKAEYIEFEFKHYAPTHEDIP